MAEKLSAEPFVGSAGSDFPRKPTQREKAATSENEALRAKLRTTYIDQFISRIEINADGCWLWKGGQSGDYGQFWKENYDRCKAHRASYEIFIGEIPDGMDVCHTCDVKKCVRPTHLFVGTRKDNMQDASSKGRIYRGGANTPWTRLLTHCKRGHPLSGDNLCKVNSSNPKYKNRRICKECTKQNKHAAWLRKKESA